MSETDPVNKRINNLKLKGRPGPGRPKGVLNKTTQAAKDAIAEAADNLGGAKRLVAWAKEDPANERVFWGTIYPKLLPLQVAGGGVNGALVVQIVQYADDTPAE